MSKRKDTPNLMENFLGGKSDKEGNKEDTGDEEPKEMTLPPLVQRTNATYHLPVEFLAEFEEFWFRVRVDLKRRNISKSNIIEAGIRVVIEDYAKNGTKGLLARELDKLM